MIDTLDGYTAADLTNFTHECVDCGKTLRVVDGIERRHRCRMPRRLRGRVGEAWADGEQWVIDHPEQYRLSPNGEAA